MSDLCGYIYNGAVLAKVLGWISSRMSHSSLMCIKLEHYEFICRVLFENLSVLPLLLQVLFWDLLISHNSFTRRLMLAFGQLAAWEKDFLGGISVQMPWKCSRNGAGKHGVKTVKNGGNRQNTAQVGVWDRNGGQTASRLD